MPPDPDELLQQATMLASRSGATQADFRRAISNAYYAVFHFALTTLADVFHGGPANRSTASSTSSYSLIYRSVDHSTLAKLCRQLSQTNPQGLAIVPSAGLGPIADFARVTGNLQAQRLLADYDPTRTFTDVEAKIAVSDAYQAMTWFNSSSIEQKRAFHLMLMFKQR